MNIKKLLVYSTIIGSMNIAFAQSAWTKKEKEIYTQVSFNDISNYSSVFNKNGEDFKPSRVITDQTLQFYGEYGLTDKLTLTASIPFKLLKTGDLVNNSTFPATIEEGSFNALGNIRLSSRYKLSDKKINIAAQIDLDLPTSSFDEATGLRSGFDATTILPTIAVGKGFKNFYVQSFGGVFFRTNDYSNGLKFYAEGGYKFFNRLWVAAFIDIVDSFEDGDAVPESTNLETFLYFNDSEYSGFGYKIIGEITDSFGVTAAMAGAFSANLEAKKASYNVGLYYKINN